MPAQQAQMGVDLGEAADVSGHDRFGAGVQEILRLAPAQGRGGDRLFEIIGAGGAAA